MLYLQHNSPLRRYVNLWRYVRNWRQYLLWKLRGYDQPQQMQVILRNGFRFQVDYRSRIEFKVVFLREDYTWPFRLNENLQGTIIDLGANVGYFTLYAAFRFPACRVMAFEPFPKNAEVLRRHVAVNKAMNCEIIEAAVSGATEEVVFGTLDDYANPTDSRIMRDAVPDGSRVFRVCARSLDEIFDSYKITCVPLLKMDIEGAEYDVLYNASDENLSRIERIALETEDLDGDRQNTDALADFLRVKGYHVIEVTPHMLHASRTGFHGLGRG